MIVLNASLICLDKHIKLSPFYFSIFVNFIYHTSKHKSIYMNNKESDSNFNYLITSEEDELWGLTVTTVGHQEISENRNLPTNKASSWIFFNVDKEGF